MDTRIDGSVLVVLAAYQNNFSLDGKELKLMQVMYFLFRVPGNDQRAPAWWGGGGVPLYKLGTD